MANPYVPLLLPVTDVMMINKTLDYFIKNTSPVMSAPLAEIKHKLDDALKQLGIVSKETPGQ